MVCCLDEYAVGFATDCSKGPRHGMRMVFTREGGLIANPIGVCVCVCACVWVWVCVWVYVLGEADTHTHARTHARTHLHPPTHT